MSYPLGNNACQLLVKDMKHTKEISHDKEGMQEKEEIIPTREWYPNKSKSQQMKPGEFACNTTTGSQSTMGQVKSRSTKETIRTVQKTLYNTAWKCASNIS